MQQHITGQTLAEFSAICLLPPVWLKVLAGEVVVEGSGGGRFIALCGEAGPCTGLRVSVALCTVRLRVAESVCAAIRRAFGSAYL